MPENINSAYSDIEAWRADVLMAMLEKKSFQDILGIMARKAANPFSVLDNNSFILGRSPGHEEIPDGTIWDTMHGNALNIFDFYSVEEWKRLSARFYTAGHEPVLYRAERDPDHLYCSISILSEGQRIGSIGTMDSHAPLDQFQLYILCMIRDMLEVYLKNEFTASVQDTFTSTALFSHIKGVPDTTATGSELLSLGWKEDDKYVVIAFDFSDMINSETEMASCISLVRMQYPKSMITAVGSQIIMCLESSVAEYFNRSIMLFLEQYDLCCGRSFAFTGFSRCGICWKQASYAAEAAKKDPQKRYIEYRNVQFRHMRDVMLGTDYEELQMLIDPAIAVLASTEKKSDRILITCLRSFLINGRSLSRTAEALGIHRNTLVYRIRRLESILDINFDMLSDDQIGALLLSCYLIDIK